MMSSLTSNIFAKLKEDMEASPVNDVTIITRPQLETIEATITRLTAALEEAREDYRESEEAREAMLVAASDFKAEALVARKTALEEAANVADEVADEILGRSGELAAGRIASAIRALVKP